MFVRIGGIKNGTVVRAGQSMTYIETVRTRGNLEVCGEKLGIPCPPWRSGSAASEDGLRPGERPKPPSTRHEGIERGTPTAGVGSKDPRNRRVRRLGGRQTEESPNSRRKPSMPNH